MSSCRPLYYWKCGSRFDCQQTIVFCQPFGLGDRTNLNLVACPTSRKVSQPVIFSLATAGAYSHAPSGGTGQFISFSSFGQGANLVYFKQERVGGLFGNG